MTGRKRHRVGRRTQKITFRKGDHETIQISVVIVGGKDVPSDIGEFFRERVSETCEGEGKQKRVTVMAITFARIADSRVSHVCVRNGESVRNKLIALAARLIKRAISLMAIRRGRGRALIQNSIVIRRLRSRTP